MLTATAFQSLRIVQLAGEKRHQAAGVLQISVHPLQLAAAALSHPPLSIEVGLPFASGATVASAFPVDRPVDFELFHYLLHPERGDIDALQQLDLGEPVAG